MNDLFLRACRGEAVERTPVWIMRQAGRYMAQYREVRKKHNFWTVCRTPELATMVTMQPIDRFGMDAAILFSDILVGLPAMGLDVDFNPGPQLENPVRTSADIDTLHRFDPLTDLGFVLDAIKSILKEIDGRIPLIGFGGAPLTLAAYMVEGGGSKNFMYLRGLLHEEPRSAKKLMSFLVDTQADYLNAQIDAGVQAIQIFDTWAGHMSRQLYREFVLEPMAQLIERVKRPGVPVIYFIRDAAHVLDLLSSIGADVISVDDKLTLSSVAEMIGPGPSLQGNLDSTVLLGSRKSIHEGVKRVLEDAPKDRGHIFNLSHGILPPTPEENAAYLVETVKRLSLVKET